jgi:hypothetical protein
MVRRRISQSTPLVLRVTVELLHNISEHLATNDKIPTRSDMSFSAPPDAQQLFTPALKLEDWRYLL